MRENLPWKEEIRKRLEGLRLAPAREAEIVEELAQHLEEDYQALLAQGVAEAEALRITLEGLSGNELLVELARTEETVSQQPVVSGTTQKKNILADLWQDLRYATRMLKGNPRDLAAHWSRGFMPIIARLRAGATLEQARRDIQSVTRDMRPLFPFPMGRDWNTRVSFVPLQQFMVSNIRTRLIVLQLAIGLVLLIACANIANLLLARAAGRQKEIAVRIALGAARGRIVRQLLTESVTLALTGGALGTVLAFWTFSVLKLALPAGAADWTDVHLGWQVMVFVSGISVLTGLVFGLAPALTASKNDLAGTIKTGGQRSAGSARTRLRSALIISELALAVVLAVSAGLLIKSLWMLAQVNPGFQPDHLLTLRVSPNQSLCRERASCIAFFDELQRHIQEIPDVHVAAANTVPLAGNFPSIPVAVEGHLYIPGQSDWPMFWEGAVTPSYFNVMRIPILSGRAFTDSDRESSEPVVIVSAAMARRYWPGQNPIGKHIRPVFQTKWRTVVGITGEVRQYDLANHSPNFIQGDMYMPYPQSVTNERQLPAAMTLIVRTGADATRLPNRIRELVKDLNPNVPVSEVRTWNRWSTTRPRSPVP